MLSVTFAERVMGPIRMDTIDAFLAATEGFCLCEGVHQGTSFQCTFRAGLETEHAVDTESAVAVHVPLMGVQV